ncbi:MAG: ZIP family metal transporter [Thermoflavifilum sp.]|nr:ZIP family metal transporter [Thermoflavifilum sp.]MCL6513026.1 ZIP family metal transporter [Alicyclobacillus sp.]
MWIAVTAAVCAGLAVLAGTRLVLAQPPGVWGGAPSARLAAVTGMGTGAFLAAVCGDRLPDALSEASAWWLLGGVVFMWILGLAVDAGFQRTAMSADETAPASGLQLSRAAAWVLVVGLCAHTLMEGGALALAAHEGTDHALALGLALAVHKFPEGILWGMAITAAFPQTRAALPRWMWFPAAWTLVGLAVGMGIADWAEAAWSARAMAATSGAMLYIALAELVPSTRELAQTRPAATWLGAAGGLAFMTVLLLVIQVLGGD